MLVTEGGRFGGFGLFLQQDPDNPSQPQLVYHYNWVGLDQYSIASESDLWPSESPAILKAVYQSCDPSNPGAPAIVTLFAGADEDNLEQIGTGKLDKTIPYRMTQDENFVVGFDTGTPVVQEDPYDMPFEFTGNLKKLTITLDDSSSNPPTGCPEPDSRA